MEIQLFSKLENEIKSLAAQEENLLKFATYVNSETFDDEDRTMVRNKQMHNSSTKRHLEEVLSKKKDIYNTQVKMMEQKLVERQSKLEDFGKNTTLFNDFPDVLEFFARKQSRLNETLGSVKKKLIQ
jgi:hypothetical protein